MGKHSLLAAKHAQVRRSGSRALYQIVYDPLPSSKVGYSSADAADPTFCDGGCGTTCKSSQFMFDFGVKVTAIFSLSINGVLQNSKDYAITPIPPTTILLKLFRCSQPTPQLYSFLIETDGGNFSASYTVSANQ